MNRIIYLILSLTVLVACTPPEKEEEGQIMEYAGDEDTLSEVNEEIDEDENEFETTYTQVLETYIGIYQDLAIMVLKEQGKNEDGTVDITGYYFYEKYQKNLDLEGQLDPVSGRYVLTEFYKGKTTGYMDFIPGNSGDSFWAPASNPDDEQELNAKKILGGDPYEMTLALQHGDYGFKHDVMMMAEEDGDFEATDELKTTIINDEYLAFHMSVTRTNAHLGSISGIAKINGDKARYLKDEDDEYMKCDIEFDLSKEGEITVIENDCSAYHGAHASFSGTYVKR